MKRYLFLLLCLVVVPDAATSAEIKKATISFSAPAYAGMPIWVLIDSPNPDKVRYPYGTNAWNIGLNELEVRRDDKPIEPRKHNAGISVAGGIGGGSIAPPSSPQGRLPLHILYSLTPGTYEVRYSRFSPDFIANEGVRKSITEQSDWTKLTVSPYPEEKRQAWAKKKLDAVPSDTGLLIGDTIPDLLAVPNSDVLQLLLETVCNRHDVAAAFARDNVALFPEPELAVALMEAIKRYGPSEDLAYLLSWQRKALYSRTDVIVESVLPFLASVDPLKVAGSIKALQFIRPSEMGFPVSPSLKQEMDTSVLQAGNRILAERMEAAYSPLAQYLGGAKPPGAGDLLWRMVRQRAAYEQSLICITWLANPNDLPLLTSEMLKDDPSDANSSTRSSVLYQFPRQYGTASYSYLVEIFTKTNARFIGSSAERELVGDNPAIFQAFEKILRTGDPTAQERVQGFVRSHFANMQSASDEEVLRFVQAKAG
jgi:hypothetical protein